MSTAKGTAGLCNSINVLTDSIDEAVSIAAARWNRPRPWLLPAVLTILVIAVVVGAVLR